MKKLLLLTFAIFLPNQLLGITQCVNLNSSTVCSNLSYSNYKIDWEATCNGIRIKAIAVCAATIPSGWGAVSESISISSNTDDNKYCFCKVLHPMVTKWAYTFIREPQTAETCRAYCSYHCAVSSQYSTGLQKVMFANPI